MRATWNKVPAAELKPGDLVRVLGWGGGPVMTVRHVAPFDHMPVVRVWFEECADVAEYEWWFMVPRVEVG